MNEDDMPDNATSPLAEDNDTPFSPPDSPQDDAVEDNLDRDIEQADLDDTHPSTDTGVDEMEAYNEGHSGSAEASEPNAVDAVADFNFDDDDADPEI